MKGVTKEDARERISTLVTRFQRIIDEGKLKNYSERRTKNEFIEPMFEALGWDMRNEYFEDEVIKEERVLQKWADYAFRLHGVIRFFVEAKGAKKNLDNTDYAKQAIAYGFNKGVTWAVLTDFEGLKVFNCEWNERNIWRNQVFELRFTQYLTEFDRLWLLSKESFKKEALTGYATTIGKRTPRKSVSELLLKELMTWRGELSKAIKKAHPTKYSQQDIDEFVQRIIDRLIFIRTCEDRKIEGNRLMEALNEHRLRGKSLSHELHGIFNYYRKTYDSKLFGRTEDDIHEIDKLKLDDRVLAGIIDALYESKDGNVRYDFALIDANVLGNVYEQYLGTILRTTAKRAKLEKVGAHRKEQGIYYTPTYVVNFIARNTLGELIKGKSPEEVEKVRVIDLACGSGSFLLKAFDVLDEYHYKADKDYKQSKLDAGIIGSKLTRKIQVIKDNIFGVDLDEKAVEIAQLNLLLKIAEKRHLLPSLEENIRQGNSIIDDKLGYGYNFDWAREFYKVIGKERFDVAIGNPPYVNMQTMPMEQEYCKKRYPEIYTGQNDLLYYFVLRGLQVLSEGGLLGYIVSRYFQESKYASRFRQYLLDKAKIRGIVDFNNVQLFGREVNVLTSIIFLEKCSSKEKRDNNTIKIVKVKEWNRPHEELMQHIQDNFNKREYSDEFIDVFEVKQSSLSDQAWVFVPPTIEKLKTKIAKGTEKLGDLYNTGQGIKSGLNAVFIVDDEAIKKYALESKILRHYIKTRDIRPYKITYRNLYLLRLTKEDNINDYPNTKAYLEGHKKELRERYQYKQKVCDWYSLSIPQNISYFDNAPEKVITPLYSTSNKFAYDSHSSSEKYYTLTDTYIVVPKKGCKIPLKYTLGILNSKLMEFYFKNTAKLKREGYYEYAGGSLSKLPIKYDKANEKRLVSLVDEILELNKRLVKLGDKLTEEKKKLEAEIAKVSKEIDELVYKIYRIKEEDKETIKSFFT